MQEVPATVGETVAEQNVVALSLPFHLRTPGRYDVEAARARNNAVEEFIRNCFVEGEHFQKLEFHDRSVLSKTGAESLANFVGLEPRITSKEETLDWTGKEHGGEPFFYACYRYTMFLDGRVAGEGEGSCNSWEEKYRYRWVQAGRIPNGLDKSKLAAKGGKVVEFEWAIEKAETTGKYGKPPEYWQRFRDAMADGTAVRMTKKQRGREKEELAVEIDSLLYRIPNEFSPDIVNTVQKMGQKRGYICAVITATGIGSKFTQDIEDMPREIFEGRERRPAEKKDPPPPKQEARRRETPEPKRETNHHKSETAQTNRETSPPPRETPGPATDTPKAEPSRPTVTDRLAKMRTEFEALRTQCPAAWFRRRLKYAEVDSLSLEEGIPLYKSLRDFIAAVREVEAIKATIDADDFGSELFNAGASDVWDIDSVQDLQGLASSLRKKEVVA